MSASSRRPTHTRGRALGAAGTHIIHTLARLRPHAMAADRRAATHLQAERARGVRGVHRHAALLPSTPTRRIRPLVCAPQITHSRRPYAAHETPSRRAATLRADHHNTHPARAGRCGSRAQAQLWCGPPQGTRPERRGRRVAARARPHTRRAHHAASLTGARCPPDGRL